MWWQLGSSDDVFSIFLNGYLQCVDDCQLAVKGSTRCQKKDLDQLFIHVNAKTNDVDDTNAYNAARALNRQEFLQVLVRVAVMKYILSGKMDDSAPPPASLEPRPTPPIGARPPILATPTLPCLLTHRSVNRNRKTTQPPTR